MLHAEAEDRRGVVVAYFFLFGIEADALADYGGFGAVGAPNWERHLKSYSENTLRGLVCAVSEGFLAQKCVTAHGSFILRRDITSHIETLHFECRWSESSSTPIDCPQGYALGSQGNRAFVVARYGERKTVDIDDVARRAGGESCSCMKLPQNAAFMVRAMDDVR